MGKFISFEGGEGSGKSTQVKLLADAMTSQGLDVLLTREPGGAAGAEEIRKLLVEGEPERWDAVTETLLHFAARRDHMETTVAPALAAGRIVITDRFADSTTAYQGYGHGVDLDFIRDLYKSTVGNRGPDLTLILDIPVDEGLARAGKRAEDAGSDEDRYERMDAKFHHRLRDGFQDIAKLDPERCVVVTTAGSVEEIHHRIRQAVSIRLGIDL